MEHVARDENKPDVKVGLFNLSVHMRQLAFLMLELLHIYDRCIVVENITIPLRCFLWDEIIINIDVEWIDNV